MNLPFLFPPFFGLGLIFYFLPSIVAFARSKRNTLSIFFLNLFLGWTLVGSRGHRTSSLHFPSLREWKNRPIDRAEELALGMEVSEENRRL